MPKGKVKYIYEKNDSFDSIKTVLKWDDILTSIIIYAHSVYMYVHNRINTSMRV